MTQESVAEIILENQKLKVELEHRGWVIAKLKHQLYGSQSEKVIQSEAEQFIFNEIEKEFATALPEQTELIEGQTRKKGRGKQKPFPEALPREEIIIDIAEADKHCPRDGTELKEIGFEITEKLKCYPARTVVLIEKKKKYACPCCKEYLTEASNNSILPKTIATPELLSFLIFSKFFQGLPLYRLEELFKLQGVELSRSKMASWLINLSEKLMPIFNILEEWSLQSGYMAIDATSVQVLKEEGRKAESKSFMWARGSPERGIVLFDYDVSGGGAVAKNLMLGFGGALQADAHRGYGAMEKEKMALGLHDACKTSFSW